MVSVVTFTDLKNRTGLSIYFWKTEAKGGHIEGTTWGVQWRYRNENNNSDIFYWKLTNEICWLGTNWITKFPTSFGSDATEISNMAAGGPFNMAAVGNNKSILWSSQNSLVIFMFGVVERNIGWLHSKPISEVSTYDLLRNTKLWVVFSRWLPIGNNELLDPVLFLRSVVTF